MFRVFSGGAFRARLPGKRSARGHVSASAFSSVMPTALPTAMVTIDGRTCTALVDTGCSCCIAASEISGRWVAKKTQVSTLGGGNFTCDGIMQCEVAVGGTVASVEVLIVRDKPFGYGVVLGMDAISALGGVRVCRGLVEFGKEGRTEECCVALPQIAAEGPGHSISFDRKQNQWTCKWKWIDDKVPTCFDNILHSTRCPLMRSKLLMRK